jgi:hypothetical protein
MHLDVELMHLQYHTDNASHSWHRGTICIEHVTVGGFACTAGRLQLLVHCGSQTSNG